MAQGRGLNSKGVAYIGYKEDRSMEEKTIAVSVEEYKKLLEASVRIGIFADFVNKEDYSISRKVCARYLGFELTDADAEE